MVMSPNAFLGNGLAGDVCISLRLQPMAYSSSTVGQFSQIFCFASKIFKYVQKKKLQKHLRKTNAYLKA